MSRQDTFIGLSPEALKIVEGCGVKHLTGNKETVVVKTSSTFRETCGVSIRLQLPGLESCVKIEEGPNIAYGLYDTPYPLSKYTMRDGTIYLEVLQTSVWFSGPYIFTCLGDIHNNLLKASEWTKEGIEAYVGELIEI